MKIYQHILIGFGISTLFTSVGLAQVSADRNYVIKNEIQTPGVNTQAQVDALAVDGRLQSVGYFDGLGRLVQTITVKASPGQKDIISPLEYDGFGREIKKFLPYADVSGTVFGSLRTTAFSDQAYFYNPSNTGVNVQKDNSPFTQTYLEFSPESRVLEQGAPGQTWQPGSGHTVTSVFSINAVADAVKKWTIGSAVGSIPITTSNYAAGELVKIISTDERGKQVIEYKDNETKTILKKVQLSDAPGVDHTGWLCTYYIYDDFNQLRFVLQPKAVELVLNNTSLATITDELCFRYEYDQRHRMIIKKVPGAGEVYMVYDVRDRLVFTQDANIRGHSQWLTTLYDGLDRPVMTGMITYAGTRDDLQTYVSGNTGTGTSVIVGASSPNAVTNLSVTQRDVNKPTYTASVAVSFVNEFTSEAGAEFTAFIDGSSSNENITITDNPLPPGASLIALTITYYDNYDFTSATYSTQYNSQLDAGNNYNPLTVPSQNSIQTMGMVTGAKVRVIETPADLAAGMMLSTVSFFDDRGRILQTQSKNYRGGLDISTNRYDFNGKVLSSYLAHSNPSLGAVITRVKTSMEYDQSGRLIKVYQTINDDLTTKRLIASNSYDELGQLKTKSIAPEYNNNTGMETLNYDYNIRGWLLGVNRNYVSDAASSNYFGFELGYDNANTIIGGTTYANQQYNGNISGTIWKSKGDGEKRKYDFIYDNLNRLLGADFNQYTGGSFNKNAGINYSVGNLSYDANGNILSMKQWGLNGLTNTLVDDLSYTYITSSNKLYHVSDNGLNDVNSKLGDFRDMSPVGQTGYYQYDANGNMTLDAHKGILQNFSGDFGITDGIKYNHLNLPSTVIMSNGPDRSYKGTITYVYDAAGNKLEKRVAELVSTTNSSGTNLTTTTYMAGMVYQNDVLQFISTEEGRIRYKPAVGNTPASFVYDYMLNDHLGNVRTVLTEEQETNEYPAASMETATSATEKIYYSKIDETKTAINTIGGYPTTDTYTSPNDFVAKVNGSGNKIGPGITLKVMAGDKFNIRVSSWYKKTVSNYDSPVNPVTDIVTALAGGIAGTGKFTSSELQSSGILTPGVGNFFITQAANTGSGKPAAFINWILFDERMNYISSSSGFEQVGADQEFKIHTPTNLPIDKSGYLYIYVSNETPNNDVFFDNLQVTHIRGPLLEENSYYPFGLTMAGISSKAIKSNYIENKKYKFQNQEYNDDLGVDIYEFKYRMDDPQIGRFWQIDPLADKYEYNSPYAFSENKVTGHVELEGKEGIDFRLIIQAVSNFFSESKESGDRFKTNLRQGSTAANNNYGKIDESGGGGAVQDQVESAKFTENEKRGELNEQAAQTLDKGVRVASTPFLLAAPNMGFIQSTLDAGDGNYQALVFDVLTLGAGKFLRYIPEIKIPKIHVNFSLKGGSGAIKYIGRLEDLKNIPRNQTFLDQLPNLGSAKANYYQNMSVLRKALREGVTIKDASWFRPNSELAPTIQRPTRTIRQTFLGAERNLLKNRGYGL